MVMDGWTASNKKFKFVLDGVYYSITSIHSVLTGLGTTSLSNVKVLLSHSPFPSLTRERSMTTSL